MREREREKEREREVTDRGSMVTTVTMGGDL